MLERLLIPFALSITLGYGCTIETQANPKDGKGDPERDSGSEQTQDPATERDGGATSAMDSGRTTLTDSDSSSDRDSGTPTGDLADADAPSKDDVSPYLEGDGGRRVLAAPGSDIEAGASAKTVGELEFIDPAKALDALEIEVENIAAEFDETNIEGAWNIQPGGELDDIVYVKAPLSSDTTAEPGDIVHIWTMSDDHFVQEAQGRVGANGNTVLFALNHFSPHVITLAQKAPARKSCGKPDPFMKPERFCRAAYDICATRAEELHDVTECSDVSSEDVPLCDTRSAGALTAACVSTCLMQQSTCAMNETCMADEGCVPTSAPDAEGKQGDSLGDPHILTFGALKYDFQAVGEFTLVRDESDGLEIQTRTAQWEGRNVSTNIAVAMSIGGDSISFSVDGEYYLNGAEIDFEEGRNVLPGDGVVWKDADSYIVVWSDNAQARFELASHINIRVFLPDSREGNEISGLLRNLDGELDETLLTRSGDTLTSPAPFDTFYGVYAESWRIAQESSLFEYLEGEDTETHTNRGFPVALATLAELTDDERADAETFCDEAAIDEKWLDACLLDVGLTGDGAFAEDYKKAAPPAASFDVDAPLDTCSIVADRICREQAVYVLDGCTGEEVLLETCEGEAQCDSGFCIKATTAALRGLVKNAATGAPLVNVRVAIKLEGAAVAALVTGASGLYAIELDPGQYELVFTAPGYLEAHMLVELDAGEVTTVTGLRQVEADNDALGTVTGIIADSLTGATVPDLTIEIRSGLNVITGDVIATTTTGTGGAYSVEELPPGNYTAVVSGDGYSDAALDIVVVPGQTTANQNASLAPLLDEGQVRIVLSWEDLPSDLDSHLYTPEIDGTSYQVYFSNKGSASSGPFALLDVDDTSSYGPETITITQLEPGTYSYRVNNYSGSPALAGSAAHVDVYTDQGLAESYVVPTSGTGDWWSVFEIDGETGEITTVNQIMSN